MLIRLTFIFLAFVVSFSTFAQTYASGTVLSEDGEPLIGVTVLNKSNGSGTLTDFSGKFELPISKGDSLQFTYIGYLPIVVSTSQQIMFLINMEPNVQLVDEVVIIGYGSVKKSDLTGAVSSVKAEELTKIPTSNALQALQGKVSGLSVLTTSGDPGATPVVRLRGITTLNDNNPIVVIDGIISDLSVMNSLNSNDIASVEVLKDASSTAIYGSRGAAGVIMVTTKRGTSPKNKINFSLDQSFESVANKIDVMDGREFATYVNEINPGTYNNLDVLPSTDWQDLVFNNNASITNAYLSASGATEQAHYFLGLGYFGQEGIIPRSGLDRISAKINSGYDLTKFLSVGLDLTLAVNDKDNAPGVVNTALRAWPIQEPFNEDGSFAEVEGGNPLAAIEFTNSNTRTLRGLGNLYTELTLFKDLRLKTSLQFDYETAKSRSFTPVYFVGPLQQNEVSRLSVAYGDNSTVISETTANYNKSFGKSTIDLLAGYSAQSSQGEGLFGSTENLLREDPSFWYLDAGDNELENVGNSAFRNTLLSYLGRFNYSYDSRYLFTATFRRDGSSKFGVNNKWGNFPSFALGWNLSNESFFPDAGIINNLKLRASWGIIGNERIPGNAQFALISQGFGGVFGETGAIFNGATFSTGGNPNLKWEETQQTDIGAEVAFLDNRLLVEVDYYYKLTNDILVNLEPIGYTGIGSFNSIIYNVADVSNSGFEWNVNYRSDASRDWSYQIGVLGSTVNNRVLDLGEGIGVDSLIVGGDLGNGQQVSRTSRGNPIGYFFGYDVEGVFQNEAELAAGPVLFGQQVGDLKYRDVNNDGVINSSDRTIIGNSIPDLIFGLNLGVNYKQFSVNADIQGQYGNDIYNGKQAIQFALLNYEDRFNDRWTAEGSTDENFRASQGGSNFFPSSFFIEDGSFVRLRNLTLAYDFSGTLLKKARLSNMRVYVRGTNLFTFTPFTGYSPDIGAGNALSGVIDQGAYPITRVISVGFNIGI